MKIKRPRRVVFVDTETTGLNPWLGDRPYSIAIIEGPSEDPDVTYYEWSVNPLNRSVKVDPDDVIALKKIMEDPRIVKCFHNAKFDIHMFNMLGIEVRGRVEDTSFMARICNNLEFSFQLKALAWKFFAYPKEDMKGLKDIVKTLRAKAKKKGWKIHDESPEADYWLCQYVDDLLPDMPRSEREQVKAMVGVYCVGDVVRTSLLFRMFEETMAKDDYYRDTYENELVLLPIVMQMERRGMAISRKVTQREFDLATKRADHHWERIQAVATNKGWKDFLPSSPSQLVKILYGEAPKGFGLECLQFTDKGNPSTDWKALREYANHSFVKDLMSYRAAVKSIDTFFAKYLEVMRPDPITIQNSVNFWGFDTKDPDMEDIYVLHPSLNQCGTVTGRFSCNDPNLQQVANSDTSARGTEPIQARTPFRPRPGYVWYLPDYAQMELRVFADVANVTPMLEAIKDHRDLNTENANRAWGGEGNMYAYEAAALSLELGHEEPSKKEVAEAWKKIGWSEKLSRYGVRSNEALQVAAEWLREFDYDIVKAEKSLGKSGTRGRSKIVTFCKLYGGGPDAVVDLLYCTQEEAKSYWKQYDRAFPEMKAYAEAATRQAREKGHIITRYNRKLQIDPSFAYRCVNYMIQGTCADLMKSAIRNCHKLLQDTGLDAHVLMTVHDELIFEIREGHNYKWLLREIKRTMEDTEGHLRVPMEVEMKRTKTSWGESGKKVVQL